jgi:hypothetical protein
MRFWLSGQRFLGIRPGISFQPSDLRSIRASRVPAVSGGTSNAVKMRSNERACLAAGRQTIAVTALARNDSNLSSGNAANFRAAFARSLSIPTSARVTRGLNPPRPILWSLCSPRAGSCVKS